MADEPQHTGGMLALIPDDPDALTVPGGYPAEQLHLTLLSLGDDVSDWPPDQVQRLRELVTASGPGLDPVEGRIIGPALFNPDGGPDGSRDPCLVLLVADSPGLGALRKWADWALTTHDDYPTPPDQFEPFLPHVTVASSDVASYGYGDATGDGGPRAAENGGAGGSDGGTGIKRLPDLGAESESAQGRDEHPRRGSWPSGAGHAGGGGGRAGKADPTGRGCAPLVPDEAVRGGGPPGGTAGERSFGGTRRRTTTDSLFDAPDSVQSQGSARVGGVRGVPAGIHSSLASAAPGTSTDRGATYEEKRTGPDQIKDTRGQSESGNEATSAANALALTGQLARLTYTGPIRFSTLRLALAGETHDVALGDQEAPVLSETKSGEVTFTPPAELCAVAAILPGPVARIVAEGKALNARGLDWVGENCGDAGATWATEMKARAGEIEVKRVVPPAELTELRKSGHTMDGRSNTAPVAHADDLRDAIKGWGDSKVEDRPKLKAHLKSEAHRLSAPWGIHSQIDALPMDPDHDGDDDRGEPDKPGEKSAEDGIEVKLMSPDPRAARLRNDWAHNPKLTKLWKPGVPGDFDRLRRHLAKYVHTPRVLNGLTANVHKLATGEWAGKNAHTGKGNIGKPLNMGRLVGAKALAWPDIEFKIAPVTDDPAALAALFDGVDDWGQVFVEPYVAGYLAALEEALGDADTGGAAEGTTPEGTDDLLETARHAAMGARMVVDVPAAPEGDGSNLFDEPVTV